MKREVCGLTSKQAEEKFGLNKYTKACPFFHEGDML
jgi:hypothetical protein